MRITSVMPARSLLLAEEGDAVDHFDLLNAMRLCCKDFAADAQQLWSRLLFGLLIGHKSLDLRKIGFLYVGNGQWRLAPAHGLRPALSASGPAPAGQFECPKQSITLEALLKSSDAFAVTGPTAQVSSSKQLEVIAGWKRLAAEFSVRMSARDMDVFDQVLSKTASGQRY